MSSRDTGGSGLLERQFRMPVQIDVQRLEVDRHGLDSSPRHPFPGGGFGARPPSPSGNTLRPKCSDAGREGRSGPTGVTSPRRASLAQPALGWRVPDSGRSPLECTVTTVDDRARYRANPSVLTALKSPRMLTREVLAGLVVGLALIPEAIAFSV